MAAILLVASLPVSSEARPYRPGGKLVPAWGAMWGTTVDGQGAGPGSGLQSLERKVGRKFEVVDVYFGWKDRFPNTVTHNLTSHGRIPIISWKGTYLQPIINGQYDGLIRARARGLKRTGKWVFLRWGWEMNGDWEPWSGAQNGGSSGGAARFRAAWHHIHDIFSEVGAWNVVWVWSPNSGDLPHARWNHFSNYYPGDRYVDWVGIDGFNWGTTHSWSSWTSLDSIIWPIYKVYRFRKPIMIAETGSVEQGGNKAKWITHARYSLHKNFPSVAAFVYYNGSDDEGAYWKVDSSASAMDAYRKMGHDPYWAK